MAPAPGYCPICGTVLTEREREGRARRYCPSCEWVIYRNPEPTAGTLVVRADPPGVLLVQRSSPPAAGAWSLPAGFLEWDEPPREAAVRELEEETGVTVSPAEAELLATRLRPNATGGYVVVIVYVAPASAASGTPSAGSDAAAARYVAPADLDALPLEPDYRPVIEDALATVTGK